MQGCLSISAFEAVVNQIPWYIHVTPLNRPAYKALDDYRFYPDFSSSLLWSNVPYQDEHHSTEFGASILGIDVR